MTIKQSLVLLLTMVLVFSCKQDELLDQNSGSADLTADISQYDNSNLGLYKGTFTTLDATERGVVEVKILDNVPSIATLTLVSGATHTLKSIAVLPGQDIVNLKFTTVAETASMASFDFSVESDGSNVSISNVILGSRTSDILILKETSRGPIATINGTWVCDTDCLPNMEGTNQTFNFAGVAGSGTLTPQVTLGAVAVFNGSASQTAGTSSGGFTTSMITGTVDIPQTIGNTQVMFTAEHRYSDVAPDCSSVTGTWSYESPSAPGVPASGTMISDVAGPNCPPPGDLPAMAIPLPIVGPGACVGDDTLVDLAGGGFTASGIASTCAVLANNDIFYTWTASTDALTITADTGASLSNPQVTVYDFTGGVLGAEIDCTVGSSFGAVTASGWAVSDELLIRLSANGNIGLCFEEFSLPSGSVNNLCASALPIACGETIMGNTLLDTDDHNLAAFADSGKDVFYTYTEGAVGQTVTVSLCGSGFDTRLFVYSDGCDFASLAVQNDDFCGGQSQVTFSSTASTAYTIVVDGYGSQAPGTGASGAFTLAVTCVAPPPPPPTCGGTNTTETGSIGNVPDNNCDVTNEFPLVAPVTATGTIGVDTDIDNVTIDIDHTWTGDLDITLIAPSGSTLDLSSGNGGSSGGGYFNTVFRDGAPSITTGTVPYVGVFQAEGGTFGTAFAGEDITGAAGWILQVCDTASGDTGIVYSWSIDFCDAVIPDPLAPTIITTRTETQAEKAKIKRLVEMKKRNEPRRSSMRNERGLKK